MLNKPIEVLTREKLRQQLLEIGNKPTCADCLNFVSINGFCSKYQQKVPPEYFEVYDNHCPDFEQDIPF